MLSLFEMCKQHLERYTTKRTSQKNYFEEDTINLKLNIFTKNIYNTNLIIFYTCYIYLSLLNNNVISQFHQLAVNFSCKTFFNRSNLRLFLYVLNNSKLVV